MMDEVAGELVEFNLSLNSHRIIKIFSHAYDMEVFLRKLWKFFLEPFYHVQGNLHIWSDLPLRKREH